MLDINKLVETIILDRNPKTKIRSNSSNDGMPRFANISLALFFFLRRRFISTKQIYKKNHTYNTKHTTYKRKEIKAKKETRNIKRRKKKKWG